MLIVQVVLPIRIFEKFDYICPIHLKPLIGTRVNVPFGNRNIIGIIINIKPTTSIPIKSLKKINQIIDNQSLFNPELWNMLRWAADYYHYPLGKILFFSLPSLLRKGQKCTDWHSDFSKTINNTVIYPKLKSVLNDQQKIAIKTICNQSDKFNAWLLTYFTKLEKTEVYLHIIHYILTIGRQVLILVPEISLISELMTRLKKTFNIPIDVIHSGINNTKCLKIWMKVRKGEIYILIGTRSALLTSFLCLGIIIIDEEHDCSYKQLKGWKYQARDLAVFLSQKLNIPIVLSSATPSLETLYNVQLGKYKLLQLKPQTNISPWLFKPQIINLKTANQRLTGLSNVLIKKITLHLQCNNQVFLFLNKRGFSTAMICKKCGWIAKCNLCNHNFTYHKEYQYLQCHYCNNTTPIPEICENCGIRNLIKLGIGTEQIEYQLKKIFPNIPISRIDRDTINNKTIQYYLTPFLQKKARILIGTQILAAKEYHFPQVTLVALLNIDGALFSGDFRSSERLAQLYIQVARYVSFKKSGEILLQTYHPNHPLLNKLLYQSYESFTDEILKERKIISLPPYTNHVLIRAEDNDNYHAKMFLHQIRKLFNTITDNQLLIMGPIPALQSKCNGKYRWQLLLQHPIRRKLQDIIKFNIKTIFALPKVKHIKWSLDVDPIEN
ncbi:MAG: primosomal protein N' [Candidatus Dasytiphilus stammeri]